MSDICTISLTGRLTRDAELRTVGQKGTSIASFGVAVNTGYGQYATTTFYNAKLWGQKGQNLINYLKKGKQVALSGTLANEAYTGQDGVKRDSWTITVSDIALLADSKGRPQNNADGVYEEEEEVVW